MCKEQEIKKNKKHKDSIFTDLFQNHPENFLSLYNAIHNTDLKLEEVHLESERIEQSLYHTYHNDVSMMINGRYVILMEHQSTINENIPLRMLDYVTRIYEKQVPRSDRYKKNRTYIPVPEFFVFYNGKDSYPDEKVLKLSDSFIEHVNPSQLELQVTVFNIQNPTAKDSLNILNRCGILKEYCECIDIIRNTYVKGRPETYDAAIAECLKKGLLGKYMEQYSKEKFNMLLDEYDYETDIQVQRQESYEKGISDAKLEGAVIAVKKFNITPQLAAQEYSVSLDELLEKL